MKIFNVFIIVLVLSSALLHAEWKPLDINPQKEVTYYSMDWSSWQLGAIYQVKTIDGYDKRYIKLTTDAGATWKTHDLDSISITNNLSSGDELIQLNYINNNIYCMGISRRMYLSTDNGEKWSIYKPLPTGKNIVSFNKKKNIGLIYNYKTSTQPGTNYLIDNDFNIIDTLLIPKDLKINTADGFYCYFDKNIQYYISNDGEKKYELWRVVNGEWLNYSLEFQIYNIKFIDEKIGYSYSSNNNEIKVYLTNDSGKTWQTNGAFFSYLTPKIEFVNSKTAYRYYSSGDSISKSTDGGQTWLDDLLPGNDTLYNSVPKYISFTDKHFYLMTYRGIYREDVITAVNDENITKTDNMMIFPNPIEKNGLFTLLVQDDFNIISNLKLYSQTGQYISDIKFNISEKTITGFLPENLSAGVYFMEVNIDDNRKIIKIITR